MTLDTHQHFWRYDAERYAWIDDEMQTIRRDFLPQDLAPVLADAGIQGSVAVQAEQTEAETRFLLDLAEDNDFVEGVVGWVDLRAPDVQDRLAYWSSFEKLRGFRHIVQGEEDVNFLLRPAFQHGLKELQHYNFTYDILVFPHQLGAALELVRSMPDQPFVIDHIAKPYIKDGFIDGWATLIQAIATCPNVHCKVSGMITEANWQRWTYDDFVPYLDLIFSAFGAERVMYGSDWPVCLVAGTYNQVIDLVQSYTQQFSDRERELIFGFNGRRFYGLPHS